MLYIRMLKQIRTKLLQMKYLVTLFILILSISIYGQQMTLIQWEKEAATNKRMIPKYGNIKKNQDEIEADNKFLENAIRIDTTAEKASAHFIDLGFQYLYRDIKTAMYRFNQAFLLDSTNSDIYWGYGAIYFSLNNLELARIQYKEGLGLDPNNSRIMTDLGTTYMSEYFATQNSNLLDKAISTMSLSYVKDRTNQNTMYKLSSCYLMRNDCENALKFFDACMSFGGDPVTEEYKVEIAKRCK
jgi:tetratricopeptide (TPR) repeat protein